MLKLRCTLICFTIVLFLIFDKDRGIQFFAKSHFLVPDAWATIDIQNSTGENALNNTDYILTCTVTAIEGITLPVTVEWVGPDGDVVTSEGNRMVGEVEVQGRVSTLSLSFSPVYFTDGGNYTCRAAISVPWLSQQPQRMTTVEMPVTSEFTGKLMDFTYCIIVLQQLRLCSS